MIIVIFPVAISYTGTFDWNMVEDFLHDYEKSKYSSFPYDLNDTSE